MRYRNNEISGTPEIWDDGLGDYRPMSGPEAEKHRIHLLSTVNRPPIHVPMTAHPVQHDEVYLDKLLRQKAPELSAAELGVVKQIAMVYAELVMKRFCR